MSEDDEDLLATTEPIRSSASPADVQERDPEFEQLYATYFPLLRRIAARKFAIPQAEVDPLVHDVFATYLTHAERVREVRSYLIGGICNAARQYWRRNDAERQMFCDSTPCEAIRDDAAVDSVARRMDLRAVLDQLGASCQDMLYRFYVRGESAVDIAASRGTTANSICRLLSYCRRSARERLRATREAS